MYFIYNSYFPFPQKYVYFLIGIVVEPYSAFRKTLMFSESWLLINHLGFPAIREILHSESLLNGAIVYSDILHTNQLISQLFRLFLISYFCCQNIKSPHFHMFVYSTCLFTKIFLFGYTFDSR